MVCELCDLFRVVASRNSNMHCVLFVPSTTLVFCQTSTTCQETLRHMSPSRSDSCNERCSGMLFIQSVFCAVTDCPIYHVHVCSCAYAWHEEGAHVSSTPCLNTGTYYCPNTVMMFSCGYVPIWWHLAVSQCCFSIFPEFMYNTHFGKTFWQFLY